VTQRQRVMSILNDGKPHTHHEFYGFCVLHSRISELRKKGFNIACWRDGDNYVYKLLPSLGAVRESEEVWADGTADPPTLGLPSAEQPTTGPAVSLLPSSLDEAQPVPTRQLEIWEAAA
jgi:hypothetical protein